MGHIPAEIIHAPKPRRICASPECHYTLSMHMCMNNSYFDEPGRTLKLGCNLNFASLHCTENNSLV